MEKIERKKNLAINSQLAEILIERLMQHFKVNTISKLATYIDVSQPSISAWKKNGYVNAIFINEKLLEKAKIEAEKYGLNLTSYIEHLIVQDIKKH